MTIYIGAGGEKRVDPGHLPAGQVRKLRRASRGSRGTRRGRDPLSSTESQDLTPPRGTGTTDDAA